jgi:hypothetical protein
MGSEKKPGYVSSPHILIHRHVGVPYGMLILGGTSPSPPERGRGRAIPRRR